MLRSWIARSQLWLWRQSSVTTLLLMSASGGACSAGSPSPPPAHASGRQIIADVIVTVINRTGRAAHIILVAGVNRHSLGIVERRASRSFSVPSDAGDSTNALRMEARSAGTSAVRRSNIFHLASGQRAIWTITSDSTGVLTKR
jgi:hypothetical protein